MNQKGFAPIVVLLGILVLTIFGGGTYYFSKQNTPVAPPQITVSPVPQKMQATNWETYTNNDYGIEFQYPEGWEKWEKDNFIGVSGSLNTNLREMTSEAKIEGSINQLRVFIGEDSPQNFSGQTMEQKFENHKSYWVNSTSEFGDYYPKQITKEKIMVEDREGIKYLFDLQNPQQLGFDKITWVYVSNKDKFINFRFEIKDQRLIDQILSTFKFN